jgi:hypothetical protein
VDDRSGRWQKSAPRGRQRAGCGTFEEQLYEIAAIFFFTIGLATWRRAHRAVGLVGIGWESTLNVS